MAISLATHRIRVNAISSRLDRSRRTGRRPPRPKPRIIPKPTASSIRWGGWEFPEDVAKACRFIAEQAGFMTGQNIILDGGMTVKMIYV